MGSIIALCLGLVYLLLEILLVQSIIQWSAIFPFVFLLLIISCTSISIVYKNPIFLIGCFVVLAILDFYYVVGALNETFYIEFIDQIMFPESFPFVHTIIVLVCILLLTYFSAQKPTATGNSESS